MTNQIQIKPIGNKIVVEQIKNESIKQGGIIIPESANHNSVKSKVIAVANDNMDVKVSDIILTAGYQGAEVKIDGRIFHVLEIEEVIAILENIE